MPPLKKTFIHFFFQQKPTDHLLCASTVLDAETIEISIQEPVLPTYIK